MRVKKMDIERWFRLQMTSTEVGCLRLSAVIKKGFIRVNEIMPQAADRLAPRMQKGDKIMLVDGKPTAMGVAEFRKSLPKSPFVMEWKRDDKIAIDRVLQSLGHDEAAQRFFVKDLFEQEQVMEVVLPTWEKRDQSLEDLKERMKTWGKPLKLQSKDYYGMFDLKRVRFGANTAMDDDGLAFGMEIIRTRCPISMKRIVDPVRGNLCSHHQCFDRASFEGLSMDAQSSCPICMKEVHSLVPVHSFALALSKLGPNGEYFSVQTDQATKKVSYVPHNNESKNALDVPDSPVSVHEAQEKSQLENAKFAIKMEKVMKVEGVKEAMPNNKMTEIEMERNETVLGKPNEKETYQPIAHPEMDHLMAEMDVGSMNSSNPGKKKGKGSLKEIMEQLSRFRIRDESPHALWRACDLVESNGKAKLKISGTEVLFPFAKPLPPQVAMMGKILSCLNKGKHGLLESPTGTGKTASLLCSILAWQRQHDLKKWAAFSKKPKKIVYCTRTHSQAQQVAKAVGSTAYRPQMVTLASKKHLCSNNEIRASAIGVEAGCAQAMRKSKCKMYLDLLEENYPSKLFSFARPKNIYGPMEDPGGFIDLEDLLEFGKSGKRCSYYSSQALVSTSQLTVAPYQYLLNPAIATQVFGSEGITDDFVLVFDEGHNVEGVCLDAGSAELSIMHLMQIVRDLCIIHSLKGWATQKSASNMSHLAATVMPVFDKLTTFLLPFREKYDKEAVIRERQRKPWERFKTDELRNYSLGLKNDPKVNMFLRYCNITTQEVATAMDAMEEMVTEIRNGGGEDDDGNTAVQVEDNERRRRFSGRFGDFLEKGMQCMNALALLATNPGQYSVSVTGERNPEGGEEEIPVHLDSDFSRGSPGCCRGDISARFKHGSYLNSNLQDRPKSVIKLKLQLLDAGVIMNKLSKAHSIILTSGTLFPIDPLMIGDAFSERLHSMIQLNHVVKRDQVYVGLVSRSPKGAFINGSFAELKKLEQWEYEKNVGDTIFSILRDGTNEVHGGILVFLPSYKKLAQFRDAWETTGLMDMLEGMHGNRYRVVVEDSKRPLNEIRDEYLDYVSRGLNPILLCVFRGRLSEGVDFKDEACRMVFLVSIPYPSFADTAVKHKMKYNDFRAAAPQSKYPNGSVWYRAEGFRALSQALGRVIRHRHDFGAIFLIDSRYESQHDLVRSLPKWVHGFIRRDGHQSFKTLVDSIKKFFRHVPVADQRQKPNEPTQTPQPPALIEYESFSQVSNNSPGFKRTFTALSTSSSSSSCTNSCHCKRFKE